MAEDFTLPLKRAALIAMKHDAFVAAIIPPASMFPGTVPADPVFPFSRFGTVMAAPFRASGLDSSSFRFSVQGFTKPLRQNPSDLTSPIIATAEDQIYKIGSKIKDCLDNATLTLDGGRKARFAWVQTLPMIDGADADAWMTTVTFRVEVAG